MTVVAMLVATVLFQDIDTDKNRYHQHLEALPKTECTDHADDVFCTHLPLLSITTDGAMPGPYLLDENGMILKNESGRSIPNDEMISASVQYFDNETQNNHLVDAPTVDEQALTRIRGRSSRAFDKNGCYIKFKEENLIDNKNVALSDMTADSDWVLHGPYLDKSLIRNYLCYNLSGEIMEYSPNVRFCEMFLNGEYMGVYVLTEKIGYNDDGRINITETDEKMRETSYILKLDVGTTDPLYDLNTFISYTGKAGWETRSTNRLEIIYPSSTLTQIQKDKIEIEISNFEKALVSFDSNHEKYGYPAFIDVSSFVEYFVINEFTMNSDAARLSTYYYKDIRGKVHMAVWDFNSAFNNYIPEQADPQYFMMIDKFWFEYLLKDKAFVDEIIHTYEDLRKNSLSDDYLLNYIDETVVYLGDAIERNNEKWGYSYDYDMLEPVQRNPETFDEAVTDLKDMIVARGKYMDENIDNLYSLCHDSVNKQFNHEGGK